MTPGQREDGLGLPHTIGNPAILQSPAPKLALFCSVRCPGALILQAYDLARDLRDAGVIVVSGFHTPVERDILTLLLRGAQPIVLCPARTLTPYRIPPAWKAPIAEGRLLLISPFDAAHRRPTAALATERNHFAAHLAAQTLIIHATPGGATHYLAQQVLSSTIPISTLDHPSNAHLIEAGIPTFALSAYALPKLDRDIPGSEPAQDARRLSLRSPLQGG